VLKHLTQKEVDALIKAADTLNAANPPSDEEFILFENLESDLNRWRKIKPHREALHATIASLSPDARLELLAPMWFGRGDVKATFDQLLSHARTFDQSDEGDMGYIADKSRSLPLYLNRGLAKLR